MLRLAVSDQKDFMGRHFNPRRSARESGARRRTMTPDRLRGSAHAVVNEPERRAVRIGYEMQFALVESVPSSFLTDIDEADIGEWTCKERFNPTA